MRSTEFAFGLLASESLAAPFSSSLRIELVILQVIGIVGGVVGLVVMLAVNSTRRYNLLLPRSCPADKAKRNAVQLTLQRITPLAV